MTAQTHAAVWLDHRQARIFHVDLDGFDEQTLQAPAHHVHRHPKGATEQAAHPEDERRFFAEVAKALAPSDQILVLGPSTAKSAFLAYARAHVPALVGKIAHVETSDHPTDKQIVAHVRDHFKVPAPRLR